MLTYEKALSYARSGEAVFIVGSGFSIDSLNSMGLSLMSGGSLAQDLANKVSMEPDTPLDIVSQEYIDQIGEKSLAQYLKEHYEVSEYKGYYNIFAKIKELKVYTTNYDNLIELICKNNNKKIKSYNLSARLNKCDKKNMVMHLNGYVEDIQDELPLDFNLTHLSYNHSPLYSSPWFPYIKDEIRCAQAIFIIGLSFKSDLELRRLINDEPEITDKCFIVESPEISEKDKNYLSKYGRIILSGVSGFCEDLSKAEEIENNSSLSSYKFKSFVEYKKSIAYNELTDKKMFDMFFLGQIDKDAFYQNEEGNFVYLVNRSKLNNAWELLNDGKSIIIHSDLGNGKSVFLKQLLYKLKNYKIFNMIQRQNDKLIKEIEYLTSSGERVIIVIDPYNLYLNDFEKFKNFELSNIQFIMMARTAMHENCCNILYDITEEMRGIDFSASPINLNSMELSEILQLNNLLLQFGFWGNITGTSENERIELLSNKLNGKFQNILLYLFDEGQIKGKFENIIRDISADELVMKILILTFINEILELNLNVDDFNIIFNRDNIDKIIRRRKDDLGELVNYTSNEIRVKSSIISKSLIGSDVIPKQMVLDTLLMVSRRLDQLYEGNRKYNDALKNLASASYLSFIFDYTLDSKILIKYYEKIKESNFNKQNLFFWEQYAITCVNVKEFSRAKKYFETSYSLAKKRGRAFSTFQIDNHYARFLLESQIYVRDYKKAISTFVEAHKLLTKKYISDDIINDRYYQFRVAVIYKEYYDVFYSSFDHEEKRLFILRCNEIYEKLINYINGCQHNDYRRYIDDCKRNLEYILKTCDEII